MKKYAYISLLVAASVLLWNGCSEEPSVADPSNGPIQANSYVAIGNSVTAGVQSGSMYKAAQLHSYPNLIAQQIGAEFVQPLMSGKGTGERISIVSLDPVTLARDSFNIRAPDNFTLPRPYNNLGVPLALVSDLEDESAFGNRQNLAFQLILRDQEAFGKSVLEQALNLRPTLVTLWIGNNDVLNYASSGGTLGTDATGTLPTESSEFEADLASALDYISLRAPNAKAVLGNIPEIASLPFFTTVPTALYMGDVVAYLYIVDSQAGVRKATNADMLLLTAQEVMKLGYGLDSQKPIPSRFVLDPHEQSIVAQAVSDYNAIIDRLATSRGYAVADIHGVYDEARNDGYTVAGETFTADFISGGLFSLDGIHPSSKGSGLVANEFIRAMNRHYGSNIRYVSISGLPGIPVQ